MIFGIAAIIATGCLIIATMEYFERKDCNFHVDVVECEQEEKP